MTRLAAESSRGDYDRVVVCGGDGTLNLAVRDFDLERGTLALIPQGSGDDFARVTGIPRHVREACDVVLRGLKEARRDAVIFVEVGRGLREVGVARGRWRFSGVQFGRCGSGEQLGTRLNHAHNHFGHDRGGVERPGFL